MSNNTPPKEIYLLGQDLEFMVNDGRKHLYSIDASLTDVLGKQVKYLSEESVKEMLAEKDRRINNLLERIKFRDDQIDIDANSILSMNADLKAKDKEIERLKAINKEAYNNGYANGQLDLIRD